MPARVLFVVSILYLVLSVTLLVKPIFAQTASSSSQLSHTPYMVTPIQGDLSPQSPQYANLIFINLVHTLSCFTEGRSIVYQPCLGMALTEDKNKLLTSVPVEVPYDPSGGLLGTSGDIIAFAFATPPVRTSEYLADLQKNLGVIRPAYAQVTGSGAGVISPVKKIWELSRNVAYLGMTAIFIVIGFMLMFRRKLNPQTVISVQAALPGLVVSLILITFSYFIVALIVDTGFVSSHLVAGIFQAGGIVSDPNKILESENGIFSIFTHFITGDQFLQTAQETADTLSFLKQGIVGSIVSIISAYVGCKLGAMLGPSVSALLTAGGVAGAPVSGGVTLAGAAAGLFFGTIGKPLEQFVGCAVGGLAGVAGVQTGLIFWLAGLFLYVILIIALIIAMFRVLYAVISAYISIITLTIMGPMRLLVAAIPGSKSSPGNWIKELFANVMIFPALYAVFFVAAYILGNNNDIANNFGLNSAITPKNTDFANGAVPFLNNLSTTFLRIVLGYGILLLTPNVPDFVKGYLGVKDPGYGKMVIGAVTGGFGLGKNFVDKSIGGIKKDRDAIKEAKLKLKAQKYADSPNKGPATIAEKILYGGGQT